LNIIVAIHFRRFLISAELPLKKGVNRPVFNAPQSSSSPESEPVLDTRGCHNKCNASHKNKAQQNKGIKTKML